MEVKEIFRKENLLFGETAAAKEELIRTAPHYIVARGRKGGSNVAAAICNALMYRITR